jgi:hypothetical protein
MTYLQKSAFISTVSIFLVASLFNLKGAISDSCSAIKQHTLHRNKNFNITPSENPSLDSLEKDARLEGNAAIIGFRLYENCWDSQKISNIIPELMSTEVPPQNIFAIIKSYVDCIEEQDLKNQTLSVLLDNVLQQSVIAGKLNYVVYLLTDPSCKEFISLEHIEKSIESLSLCHNICMRNMLRNLLSYYQMQQTQSIVMQLFCLTEPQTT